MIDNRSTPQSRSIALTTLLAWIVPGLGHWWLGERKRAMIFFVATTVTFWTGIAVGGVRSSVTPRDNGLWIAAQLCTGPQSLIALGISNRLAAEKDLSRQFRAPWPASDIGVVYAGVAGLLNLLVILDVIARIEAQKMHLASRGPPRKVGS